MSAALETLLPRIEGVKQTAPDTYIGICPGHPDKSPSLSIKEVGDRVLIHDFAGCSAGEVMAALGLSLSDLFNEPLPHQTKPATLQQRRRYGQAQAAFEALSYEALIVCLAAESILKGYKPEKNQTNRLRKACYTIRNAYALAGRPLANGVNR